MDELDVTSEEEEEEEGEAEGETEGDEMEDEMTDVWWKTCPYCSQPLPFPATTLSNHEAWKNKDQSKRVEKSSFYQHISLSVSSFWDQPQKAFP